MAILGIRKRIKQVIKDVMGLSAPPSAPSTYASTAQEAKSNVEQEPIAQKESPFAPSSERPDKNPESPENIEDDEVSSSEVQTSEEKQVQETQQVQENSEESQTSANTDTQEVSDQKAINSDFTFAAVEEVLDDMIRPALQNDGGDITLVEIKDNSIYVQLRGACGTCPSSTATMQFGVKNLLNEEFPAMVHLYDVTSGTAMVVEDATMS